MREERSHVHLQRAQHANAIDGRQIILPTSSLANPLLTGLEDQAHFEVETSRLVVSTDSFVVSPLFFPGGDNSIRGYSQGEAAPRRRQPSPVPSASTRQSYLKTRAS